MYKIVDNKKIQIENFPWDWDKSHVEKMSDVIMFEDDDEKERFIIRVFRTLPFVYDECDPKVLIVLKKILDSKQSINSRLGMMQTVQNNYEEWIEFHSVDDQLKRLLMKKEEPLFAGGCKNIREYLDLVENAVDLLLLNETVIDKIEENKKIIEKRKKKK